MLIKTNINNFLTDIPESQKGYGVIIGNFDGVHIGHEYLLKGFKEKCKKEGVDSLLVTLSPHPYLYFNHNQPFLLMSEKEKLLKLESYDLSCIVCLSFDSSLQKMNSKKFLENFLLKIPKLKLIYLGHDFKLGSGKEESKGHLEELAKSLEKNISIYHTTPYCYEQEIVSSSRIRKLYGNDIEQAAKLLGENVSIEGQVVPGKSIGKKELVPTANIAIDSTLMVPKEGVYITEVIIDNDKFSSVTNIGFNPTIALDNKKTIETHIFFFNKEIYNKKIKLVFIKKIRNEKKFNDLDELKKQISKDVEYAQQYFRKNSSIRLALIGKNIAHSRSAMIYEKLLGKHIHYRLIDCVSAKEIPTIKFLKENYQGVSITSPYKKFFLDKVELEPKNLDSINTLCFSTDKVYGKNTDIFAIRKILQEYLAKGVERVFILGDGAMSNVLQDECTHHQLKFEVFSRRKNNLKQDSQLLIPDINNGDLVVNTCAREYIYNGPVEGKFYFWDMNYDLKAHENLFGHTDVEYKDGLYQLELQAKYALSFWNL